MIASGAMGPSQFGLDGDQLESIDCLLVLVSLPASSDKIGLVACGLSQSCSQTSGPEFRAAVQCKL